LNIAVNSRHTAAVVASALIVALLLGGCTTDPDAAAEPGPTTAASGDPTTSAESAELTATDVAAKFTAWACPGDPRRAGTTYQPQAALAEPGRWIIETLRGQATYDEADETFSADPPLEQHLRTMQRSTRCQDRSQ